MQLWVSDPLDHRCLSIARALGWFEYVLCRKLDLSLLHLWLWLNKKYRVISFDLKIECIIALLGGNAFAWADRPARTLNCFSFLYLLL